MQVCFRYILMSCKQHSEKVGEGF
uniref:Uncharacterized protein n=1 Tax=Rhizophora mucronata TaxID=61149 RepID=A0A2P2QK71_RHIMU